MVLVMGSLMLMGKILLLFIILYLKIFSEYNNFSVIKVIY